MSYVFALHARFAANLFFVSRGADDVLLTSSNGVEFGIDDRRDVLP